MTGGGPFVGIPCFRESDVNRHLLREGGIEDAFQRFVHELLTPRYPGLHLFSTGGKDGAIDHYDGDERVAVECKHCGDDDFRKVERAWGDVADRLGRHITDPDGPTKGQGQYRPWMDFAHAPRRYLFCTSADLSNTNQVTQLEGTIRAFFEALAAGHSHLAHLAGIVVEVWDWSRLGPALRDRPSLLFRWFPGSRPLGFAPVDGGEPARGFRAFLDHATLPYYSRGEHLGREWCDGVEDEGAMMALLEEEAVNGLVITGAGGVGKTRLVFELGRRALARGWIALRVVGDLSDHHLASLLQWCTGDTPVLLLFDYVETQRDFATLAERIDEYNQSRDARLRYVANCRTSFYGQLRGAPGHRRIDLSPVGGDAREPWQRGYRGGVVAHILGHCGVVDPEAFHDLCGDTPILAVFVAYLQAKRDVAALDSLRNEADFGGWVQRRVAASFGRGADACGLAHLMALFPLDDTARRRLAEAGHGPLIETLVNDGWVERSAEGEGVWVTLHDLVADRLLLNCLENNPAGIERWVEEALALAVASGTVNSLLISLQRLADFAPLKDFDWPGLVKRSAEGADEAWREAAMERNWDNFQDVTQEELTIMAVAAEMRAADAINPLHKIMIIAKVLSDWYVSRIAGTPIEHALYDEGWHGVLEERRSVAGGYESIETAGVVGLYQTIGRDGEVEILFANDIAQDRHGIDAVGYRKDVGRYLFYESKGTTRAIGRSPGRYLAKTKTKGYQLSWEWCWNSLIDYALQAPTALFFLSVLDDYLNGRVERALVVSGVTRGEGGYLPDGRVAVWNEEQLREHGRLATVPDLEKKRGWLEEVKRHPDWGWIMESGKIHKNRIR